MLTGVPDNVDALNGEAVGVEVAAGAPVVVGGAVVAGGAVVSVAGVAGAEAGGDAEVCSCEGVEGVAGGGS